MRKKFKPCFMLMAVVSMIGLFFCTMARACPPGTPGRAREEQTVKDHPEMAKQMQEHWDGKQQSATTTIIRRSPLWFSNFKRKSMQPKNTIGVKTMTEEKNDGEKEVLVPLCVQAANLRDAFEKDGVTDELVAKYGLVIEEIAPGVPQEGAVTFIKVGDKDYKPTVADLNEWQRVFEEAKNDPDFKIFSHSAIDIKRLTPGVTIITGPDAIVVKS